MSRKDVFSYDNVGEYIVVVEELSCGFQVDVKMGIPERYVWGCLLSTGEEARNTGIKIAKGFEELNNEPVAFSRRPTSLADEH